MRIRGSQTNLVNAGSGLKQQADFTYLVEIDPTGGLQLGALGVKVKSGGITSAMIAAGAVLGAHIGFNDSDIPNTSTLPGASVKDALSSVSGMFSAYLKHDGSVAMTGDLNMAGKKIVGMAMGTSPGDAVTLLQLQQAVLLQNQQLYSCAYAGVGTANGALMVTGSTPFVRASQTIFLSANPSAGDTLSLAGVTLTFVAGAPGPLQVQIGGSAAITAARLATAINSAGGPPWTTPHGTALMSAVYAVRESTGLGQTIHVVWKDDDLPGRTPTDANNNPGYGCATSNPAVIKFVAADPITGTARFYGAYDSVKDGAVVQARYENAIYTYNEDQGGWILTYANPGAGFFGAVVGDLGGVQVAGPNATLLVEGSTTIQTVSGFFTGPKVTLTHKDASALTSFFHSEDSIKLLAAYTNVGTNVGDKQSDFNGAADVLIGNFRGTAFRNELVNATFIDDPVGGSPYVSVANSTIACMPGWALRDNDPGIAGNAATATWDTAPPDCLIGPNVAKIVIGALGAAVKHMDFYQPILYPQLYSGRKITFRIGVKASTGVKAFIRNSSAVVTSSAHTGGGGWEVLEVSTTLANPESLIEVGVRFYALDTVSVDAATCVIGAAITNLPFIARDEVSDRLAISAYYHAFRFRYMVWGIPAGPGAAAVMSIPFPTTMVVAPGVSISFPAGPGLQPVGAVPTLGAPPVASDRLLTVTVGEAANWVGAVLPDAVTMDVSLDARPT